MNSSIFRLVYCSRNLIQGTAPEIEAEINSILATARANNLAAGVTGSLLFNAGNFAQCLEGSLEHVERIFEKVQQDMRHSEVTIVESDFAPERLFGNWSMALCGDLTSPPIPLSTRAFNAAFAHVEGAGDQILGLLMNLVTQDSDLILI